MKLGRVVHKMLFKEKVYGHTTDDGQRPITKKRFVIVGMIVIMATAVVSVLLHAKNSKRERAYRRYMY